MKHLNGELGNNFLSLQWKETLCGKVLVNCFDTIIKLCSDVKLNGAFKV